MPTDFYSEVGVSGVAISPDGALVAFTVTTTTKTRTGGTRRSDAGTAGRAA